MTTRGTTWGAVLLAIVACDRPSSSSSPAASASTPSPEELAARAFCTRVFVAPLRAAAIRCSDADRATGVHRELSAHVHSAVRSCELRAEKDPPTADPACVAALEEQALDGWLAGQLAWPAACESHRRYLVESRSPRSPWDRWSLGERVEGTATPGSAFTWRVRREAWIEPAQVRVLSLRGTGAPDDVLAAAVDRLDARWGRCVSDHAAQVVARRWKVSFRIDEEAAGADASADDERVDPLAFCLARAVDNAPFDPRAKGASIEVELEAVPGRRNTVAVADSARPRPFVPEWRRGEMPAPKRGEACIPDRPCEDPSLSCRLGRCDEPAKLGEACSGDPQCVPGTWCKPAAPGVYSVPGTCHEPQATGSSCTEHRHCRGACSLEGQCIAFCGKG